MQSLLDAAAAAGEGLPPVEKWNPAHCGTMDMEIRRDGSWWHDGRRITRDRLVRLFSTILRKDDDGVHYLVTPVEKQAVRVEIAPFLAVRVDRAERDGRPVLIFTTNLGDLAEAGPDHPIRVEIDKDTGEPTPFVIIRGRLEALITRPVFYELVDMAQQDGNRLTIESSGETFELGWVA
ncbi:MULTISPECIES: DUF1285 domain-containing protein [Hyphobacterium]|uniref:DUF1285 domain-containing protein n=1 Tax=Hyphobacterium vulgare TaxID=1736751 RepID=A0ABV6ZZ80_9PROT